MIVALSVDVVVAIVVVVVVVIFPLINYSLGIHVYTENRGQLTLAKCSAKYLFFFRNNNWHPMVPIYFSSQQLKAGREQPTRLPMCSIYIRLATVR